MTDTDLVQSVRQYLRISHDQFDSEILDLIESAKADLRLSGISDNQLLSDDPLIKRAIVVYCKAEFGLENADSEKYRTSYEMLKMHLALSADYTGE